MGDPLVVLRLSPAQARAVNSALALLETEVGVDEDDLHQTDPAVLDRTRAKVHAAMAAVGVEP